MPLAGATQEFDFGACSPGPTNSSICRTFQVESGEFQGRVDFLQVQLHHYQTGYGASNAYDELRLPGYPENVPGEQFPGVQLGHEYDYYPPAPLASGEGMAEHLMVRESNIITWWIAVGS